MGHHCVEVKGQRGNAGSECTLLGPKHTDTITISTPCGDSNSFVMQKSMPEGSTASGNKFMSAWLSASRLINFIFEAAQVLCIAFLGGLKLYFTQA